MNQAIKNRLLISLICIFLSIQYGCNSVSKRVQKAELFLAEKIDSASNKLLDLVNFQKIDGVEKVDGSLYYVLSYKAFIAAKKQCYWDGNIYSSNIKPIGTPTEMHVSETSKTYNLGSTIINYEQYKIGQGQPVLGVIVFEKRDSGWQVIEASIEYGDASDVYE